MSVRMAFQPARSSGAPPREVRRRPSVIGRDLAQGDSSEFGTLCKLHRLPAAPSDPPGYDAFKEECERSIERTRKELEEQSRRELAKMSEEELWMRVARVLEREPSAVGATGIPSRESLRFLRESTPPLEPLDEPELCARLRDIEQHPPNTIRIGLVFPDIPGVVTYCSSCGKQIT